MNCTLDPSLLEIDPRECDLCGLSMVHHRMIDGGEGPEHLCLESAPLAKRLVARKYASTNGKPFALGVNIGIDLALKELIQEEIAATDPAEVPIAPADRDPPPYRTPQATIDAFKYVVATGDLPRLRDWLASRPKDAAFLLALLESQISC